MPLKTTPFDAAEYLDTPESQADLLADALSTGDAGYIKIAIATIARARGMTEIAKNAGVSRQALYKALTPEGDPKLSTLLGVMRAFDMTFTAKPTEHHNI